MRATTITLFIALCGLTPILGAQETNSNLAPDRQAKPLVLQTPDGDLQVMIPEGGAPLEEVVAAWAEATGQRFSYSDHAILKRSPLRLKGISHVDKADVDWFFQSLLSEMGFAMIPVGAPKAKTWSLVSIDRGRNLTTTATSIPASDATSVARQPARLFITTFQLRQVDVLDVRMAFQRFVAHRNVEFFSEIRGSNSIVLVGFGSTVAAAAQWIEQIDKPLPDKIMKDRSSPPKRRSGK